jgi:hypothetical protein
VQLPRPLAPPAQASSFEKLTLLEPAWIFPTLGRAQAGSVAFQTLLLAFAGPGAHASQQPAARFFAQTCTDLHRESLQDLLSRPAAKTRVCSRLSREAQKLRGTIERGRRNRKVPAPSILFCPQPVADTAPARVAQAMRCCSPVSFLQESIDRGIDGDVCGRLTAHGIGVPIGVGEIQEAADLIVFIQRGKQILRLAFAQSKRGKRHRIAKTSR